MDPEIRQLMRRQSGSMRSLPDSARNSTGSRPSDVRWPSDLRRDVTGSAASHASEDAASSFGTMDLHSPNEPQILQTVPRGRAAYSGLLGEAHPVPSTIHML